MAWILFWILFISVMVAASDHSLVPAIAGRMVQVRWGGPCYPSTGRSMWNTCQGLLHEKYSTIIHNRPISQIPECICAISHNATFCNRNVHISVTKWCIMGYLCDALWDLWDGSIGPITSNVTQSRDILSQKTCVCEYYFVTLRELF